MTLELFEMSEMSGALRTALGSEKSKKKFAIMLRPDGYVRHGGIAELRADDRLEGRRLGGLEGFH